MFIGAASFIRCDYDAHLVSPPTPGFVRVLGAARAKTTRRPWAVKMSRKLSVGGRRTEHPWLIEEGQRSSTASRSCRIE